MARAPEIVVEYGILPNSAVRRIEAESAIAFSPSVVFSTMAIAPSFIASTMCGRPSCTLLTIVTARFFSCRYCPVPRVHTTPKPSFSNSAAIHSACGRSRSFTERNTLPRAGRVEPAPMKPLANAAAKSRSMPIVSPVDFISGPSKISTPANRAKGNTASFTATWPSDFMCVLSSGKLKALSASPAISRAAIFAIGIPVAFATNGVVRDARGLTSIM